MDVTSESAFKRDDTGTTTNGWPYHVLCVDLDGAVGPLVVVISPTNAKQYPAQYPADGRHPTQRYLDLKPPKVRA